MTYILVASHRRSGTHLLLDSIRNNAENVAQRFEAIEDTRSSVDDEARTVLIKTHLDRQGTDNFFRERTLSEQQRALFQKMIETNRTVYVYRDGRDVMASLYHYMQREESGYDVTEHLRENLGRWREHVGGWLGESKAVKVSFEQLTRDFEGAVAGVLRQLGLVQRSAVYNPYQKFDRGVGLLPGLKRRLKLLVGTAQTTSTKPRKGEIGDWKNLFDGPAKDFFKAEAGDLLIELGYEKDDNW